MRIPLGVKIFWYHFVFGPLFDVVVLPLAHIILFVLRLRCKFYYAEHVYEEEVTDCRRCFTEKEVA